jgi:hypothetical protein
VFANSKNFHIEYTNNKVTPVPSALQLHGDVLGQILRKSEWKSMRKETAVSYYIVLFVNSSENVQRTASNQDSNPVP